MDSKPKTKSLYVRRAKIKFRGNSVDFTGSEIKIIASYVLKCDQHILLYIVFDIYYKRKIYQKKILRIISIPFKLNIKNRIAANTFNSNKF